MNYWEKWLIPIFIFATVISNQLDKEYWPIIGRLFGWLGTVIAIFIFGKKYNWNNLSIIFISIFIFSKIIQLIFTVGSFYNIYFLFQAILLSVSGLVLLKESFNNVYDQLYKFAVINIIIMLFQTSGILTLFIENDITQILSTHFGTSSSNINLYYSLFDTSTNFNLLQAKPSGLTYSNQYLSLIVIAITVLHFAGPYQKYEKSTWVIVMLIVLCMAKVAILNFVILGILLTIFGTNNQRRKIAHGFLWFLLFLVFYSIIFPGIYYLNLNINQIFYSITTRLGVILYYIYDVYNIGWGLIEYINVNYPYDYYTQTGFKWIVDLTEENTGFVLVIQNLNYILPLFIIITPIYIHKCNIMIKSGNRHVLIFSLAMNIGLILASSTGPLWFSPFYLIMMGASIIPFWNNNDELFGHTLN